MPKLLKTVIWLKVFLKNMRASEKSGLLVKKN